MADIIKYLPEYLAEYKEYQEICSAENPEFELTGSAIKQAANDHVYRTASEAAIYRIEQMLDIVPTTTMSLNDRRRRLQFYSSNPPNYALQEVLDDLKKASVSGNIIWYFFPGGYEFGVEADVPANTWSLMYKKLQAMVPANIKLIAKNNVSKEFGSDVYAGGAITSRMIRRIGF